jgi:hypothetical protein
VPCGVSGNHGGFARIAARARSASCEPRLPWIANCACKKLERHILVTTMSVAAMPATHALLAGTAIGDEPCRALNGDSTG